MRPHISGQPWPIFVEELQNQRHPSPDQRGFGSDGLAMAMQGPDAMPEFWSGGFAPVDRVMDPEIVHFFSEAPEVPCRA
jgi:hypothetical protein